MTLYVTPEEYQGPIPSDQVNTMLEQAQLDIDSLTFNRIVRKGFENLTQFQQENIKRAMAAQANFLYEYGNMLSNPLSSYGINGVSMAFDSSRLQCFGGVFTVSSVTAPLRQTGLMFRGCCR